MTVTNRNISFSVNSLGPWYDELIAGIGGTVSRVPYSASVPTVAQAARTSPGNFPQVNYIIDALVPDNQTPLTPTDVINPVKVGEKIGELGAGAFSFSSFFGTDPATAGKYILLALLAILIVGVGIFAIIEPGAKIIAKDAA